LDVDLRDYDKTINEKQREAHASTSKFLLYGGATGGGKSVFLCMDALRRSLAWNHNSVGIYRWELSSFKSTTMATIEEWILSREGLIKDHNRNDRKITLVNGSIIRYGGLKPADSAAGDILKVVKSLEHSDVYLDEVTDFPEKVFDFMPTRIGRIKCQWALNGEWEKPIGHIRCTCNPELSWVKTRWIDRPLPGYHFIRATILDNERNLSPDYRETLLSNHDPDWVRRYVHGDWSAAVDFDAVCPTELILNAIDNKSAERGIIEFGVDVGAEGNDLSTIYKRDGGIATLLWEGHEPNTMKLKARIEALSDVHHPRLIKVDGIGIGKGVVDALGEDGYPVLAIIGGARPRDEDGGYLNVRAEIYWNLRKLLQESKICLPDHPETINELGTVRYSQTASGRVIQIEAKTVLKKRLGRSPDRADALVYAFAYSETEFYVEMA